MDFNTSNRNRMFLGQEFEPQPIEIDSGIDARSLSEKFEVRQTLIMSLIYPLFMVNKGTVFLCVFLLLVFLLVLKSVEVSLIT